MTLFRVSGGCGDFVVAQGSGGFEEPIEHPPQLGRVGRRVVEGRQVGLGVLHRAREDVEAVVKLIERRPRHHQLPFAELELTSPLPRHPVPLATALRAEDPWATAPGADGQRPAAPSAPQLRRCDRLPSPAFCHDEMLALMFQCMRPLGVHHVSLNVDDVKAALAFYVDDLGLTVRTDRPDFDFGGAWLDVGNQQVHLIEGAVPTQRGQHFALEVADLDSAVVDLRARGLTVTDPASVGAARQAFLDDPSGNRVELQQRPHG
jgi:glyoxylase I family protein